jgi:chromosome segregation ATPase
MGIFGRGGGPKKKELAGQLQIAQEETANKDSEIQDLRTIIASLEAECNRLRSTHGQEMHQLQLHYSGLEDELRQRQGAAAERMLEQDIRHAQQISALEFQLADMRRSLAEDPDRAATIEARVRGECDEMLRSHDAELTEARQALVEQSSAWDEEKRSRTREVEQLKDQVRQLTAEVKRRDVELKQQDARIDHIQQRAADFQQKLTAFRERATAVANR